VGEGKIDLLIAPFLVEPLACLGGEPKRGALNGKLRPGGEKPRLDLLADRSKVVVSLHHERQVLCF
jgi:hypothetical protein